MFCNFKPCLWSWSECTRVSDCWPALNIPGTLMQYAEDKLTWISVVADLISYLSNLHWLASQRLDLLIINHPCVTQLAVCSSSYRRSLYLDYLPCDGSGSRLDSDSYTPYHLQFICCAVKTNLRSHTMQQLSRTSHNQILGQGHITPFGSLSSFIIYERMHLIKMQNGTFLEMPKISPQFVLSRPSRNLHDF